MFSQEEVGKESWINMEPHKIFALDWKIMCLAIPNSSWKVDTSDIFSFL